MPVNIPCKAYEEAFPKWKRIRDCAAGRDAMIAATEEHLPKPSGLEEEEYRNDYLARGHFYNGLRRTVEGLTGAVFQKEPRVKAPEDIEDIIKDITPRGKVPLKRFARRVFAEAISVSRVGVLVDVPVKESSPPNPYCVLVPCEDVINWRLETVGSEEVLTLVVIRETRRQAGEDQFGDEPETVYRVLQLKDEVYTSTIWKKVVTKDDAGKEKEEWVAETALTPTRKGAPLNFIPFIILGPEGISPDVYPPIMLDLADANIAHWRNSVDYEYGLHLTSLPTPWCSGVDPSGENVPDAIGPGNVWNLGMNGQAGFLEFSGAGLQALKDAQSAKKGEMAALGARLLEEQMGTQETATAASMRHSGENATLADVASAVGDGLETVVRWIAWWRGVGEGIVADPDEIEVEIELNKDFTQIRLTPSEAVNLLTMWQSGGVSFETYYYQLQRGEFTRPGVSAEDELEQIEREGGPGSAPGIEKEEPPAEGSPKPNSWSVRQDGPGRFMLVNSATGEKMGPHATSEDATEAMKSMMGTEE